MRRVAPFLLCLATTALLSVPAAGASVVLNEVNCEGTDWIEVVNTSAGAVDVSGWQLTDDPVGDPGADPYTFPASTTLAAGEDLVVERVAGGFPFGISCSDTIRLVGGAGTVVDETTLTGLGLGDTWGRYPNGTGAWGRTKPTIREPNEPAAAAGGPAPDLAGWMFDPGKVVGIDLSLPQSSIDALNADPDEYRDATFTLTTTGATYGPLAVGARLKGGLGSFRDLSGKAAFKLRFNQRFLGLEKLTLNNMVQDDSMVHEVLAYDLFRAAGVAAPRAGYAYVRVNGADYGVYLNVETPDRVFLPRWFASTRHLLEGEYGADATPARAGRFEVDEGSESDLSDLDALVAAVDDGTRDFSDRMAPVADLAQMARMWAVEKYAGHWDGYATNFGPLHPNNYYLHSDDAGRFSMLPWGTDQTWVTHESFDQAGGEMFVRCRADASCDALYRAAVRDVRALVPGLDLEARATAVAALLRPHQEADPRREQSMDEIDAAVAATRAFLASRPAEVDAWLAPPAGPGPGSPAGSSPAEAGAVAASGPPGGAPAPAAVPSPLRFGRPRLDGWDVVTRVATPGAGRLGQRATIRVGERTIRTVCTAGARRPAAAVVALRCRLWPFARARLRGGRLGPLSVRTWFVPPSGRPRATTHGLVAARR